LAGILLLGAAYFYRSSPVGRVGLAALVLSALLVIPTYLTGEGAEQPIERVPGVVEERVDHHAEVAVFGLASTLAVGAIALGTLYYFRRRALPRAFTMVLMLLAFVPFGALAWTAYVGGKIRHTEIYPVGAAESAESERTERTGS
jgi:hypothetical protein